MLLALALILLIVWAGAYQSPYLSHHRAIHLLIVPVIALLWAHYRIRKITRSSGCINTHTQRKESSLLRKPDEDEEKKIS